MALSYSSHASASWQAAQMLSQSWRVKTAPVGMEGLIISRTFVLAVTACRKRSRSKRQTPSSIWYGAKTGTPPARRTRFTRPI